MKADKTRKMAREYTSEPEQNADNILSAQVYPFCLPLREKKIKKIVAPPPGTHGLTTVRVVTCGGKHIASHTRKSQGLYTAHFHSLGSHLGALPSFFFHAVWVSFTALTLMP